MTAKFMTKPEKNTEPPAQGALGHTSATPVRGRYGSLDEWCALSGLGKTRSYQLLRDGDLKAKKIGRRTLIDLDAGMAWLARQPDWTPTGPVASRA